MCPYCMQQEGHARGCPGFETGPWPEQPDKKVVWELDLEDAEELHQYLHMNRPGGYQHVHDNLLAAIAAARQG